MKRTEKNQINWFRESDDVRAGLLFVLAVRLLGITFLYCSGEREAESIRFFYLKK